MPADRRGWTMSHVRLESQGEAVRRFLLSLKLECDNLLYACSACNTAILSDFRFWLLTRSDR